MSPKTLSVHFDVAFRAESGKVAVITRRDGRGLFRRHEPRLRAEENSTIGLGKSNSSNSYLL